MAAYAAIGTNVDTASPSTRTVIWVFKPEQTTPCFTHERMSPCYTGTVIKNGLNDFEFAVPLSDKQKEEMSTASSFSATPTTVTPTPWWGSWYTAHHSVSSHLANVYTFIGSTWRGCPAVTGMLLAFPLFSAPSVKAGMCSGYVKGNHAVCSTCAN